MKKLIFITLILTLVLAMSAFGSRTRVLTMGNNNTILVDDANIWQFPSRINDYPGLAIGQIDGGDVSQFGVHWKLGDDRSWVFATYFDNQSPFQDDDLLGSSLVPFDFALLDNRRIHAFYGSRLGGHSFGARLSLFHSSQEFNQDPAEGDSKEAFGYYQLALGLTADDGSWDLAVNGATGSWTDEDTLGITQTDADGYYDFSVEGRLFWDSGPNYSYVPHAMVQFSKRGIDTLDATGIIQTREKFTGFLFELGIGQVYTPSNNVEAVIDFGILYSRVKDEFEDNTVSPVTTTEVTFKTRTIPFFKLGLDAEVFSWMDVRFGATSFWDRFSADDNVSEVKFNFANNDTFLGFGFHWGHFHVDTYADPQLFLEGFNFISGGSEDMNFQISATYEML